MRSPLLLALTFFIGCGVKAPPRPPEVLLPGPPKGVALKVKGGEPFLLWFPPEEDRNLEAFVVLHRKGCPGCPGDFSPLARIPYKGKGVYRCAIPIPQRGEVLLLKVVGENRWGYRGGSSPELVLRWVNPPPSPALIRAEPGDREVRLSWEEAKGAEAYGLYRRPADGDYPEDPTVLIGDLFYEDKGLENGTRYCYRLVGVVFSEGIPIEGIPSEEVCVTPRDNRPPPPPSGVFAMKVEGAVEVDWFPVDEEPLKGYYVWRGRCGGSLERITSEPLKESSFRDIPPEGGCWVYGVTAEDVYGNESALSRTVKLHF